MSVLIDLAQRFLCWLVSGLSPLYQWLNSGWRAVSIHLALMAFIVRVADAFLNKSEQSWFTWQIVLGVFALTLVLWWALQMRKRVVIDPFVIFGDISEGARAEPQTNNLSSLLTVELLRLSELYQDVQGQSVQMLGSALPRNETVVTPAAYVEDVRDFLQNAVSSDVSFGLGVFKVPIGALMGLIGRVLQGPHITGVLSYQGDLVILTARAGIQGRPYAWRVERKNQGDALAVSLDEMIAELACRMFTDLNLGGSVRWRATRAFNEGLRAYRDSLYTPHARRARLKEAEAHFLRALAEDEQFTVVYYNLGLVYHALGRSDSAERCFQEALRRDPSRWEIYYALAYLYYLRAGAPEAPPSDTQRGGRGRSRIRPSGMTSAQLLEKVITLCHQASVLKPRLARACNLMGVAYRGLENLAPAIHSRERAVRFGRFDVLCETLRISRYGGELGVILRPWRESLRDYVCNLAVAYAYQGSTSQGIIRHLAFWKAMYFFNQAMRLDSSFDRAVFESAKTAHLFGNYQRAIQGYRKALSLQPDQMEYRAYLARACADRAVVCAQKGKIDQAQRYEQEARAEISLLLTSPSQIRNELYTLADACLLIQEKALAGRLEDMAKLLDKLQEPPDEAWLDNEYQNYITKKRHWEAAQVLHTLASIYELGRDPEKAEDHFRKAIALLRQDGHEPEIHQLALNAWLALAMSRQGGEKLNEALAEAQSALREEPLASFELKTLSNIYMYLQDYRAARDLLEKTLLLSADDPEVYVFLGSCSVSMAQNLRNPAERTRALDEALAHLKGAVEMYDDLSQRGRLYYWMGKLYLERGIYSQAMENFRLARGLGVAPLLALHQMAWTALRQRDYQSCIQHCVTLIQELRNTEGDSEDLVAPGSWDDTCLGELEASARLLLVYCDAERDANLHDALAYAYEEVAPYVARVPVEFQLRYRAVLADCIGWLQVKRGQLEEAIHWLEASLALFGSDAGAYVHLGMALARKLQQSKNPEEVAGLRLRIGSCIEHARELDVRAEYEPRVSALEQIMSG